MLCFTKGLFRLLQISNNVSLTSTSIVPRCYSTGDKFDSSQSESTERVGHEAIDEEIVKSEILTAALNHVNNKGWNMASISRGNCLLTEPV